MTRRRLGKGLGAYFGDDVTKESTKEATKEVIKDIINEEQVPVRQKKTPAHKIEKAMDEDSQQQEMVIVEKVVEKIVEVPMEQKLKISLIEPNHSQPRKQFDEQEMLELAVSIKQYGILQPLLVQEKGGHYEIIAGERRWRAAKLAGLSEVPVVIRQCSQQETMEIALIENVQRADLNPIEEAQAYQRLIQEFALTQEEIAKRVAKSRVSIANSMRLLKLDERVQLMLTEGKISSGHARALLGLENQDEQFFAAEKIIKENLSVRDVEKLVKLMNRPEKEKTESETETGADINLVYKEIEERLKTVMGTKVVINRKDKNKGRIEIEYYSQEELERLIELMESMKI